MWCIWRWHKSYVYVLLVHPCLVKICSELWAIGQGQKAGPPGLGLGPLPGPLAWAHAWLQNIWTVLGQADRRKGPTNPPSTGSKIRWHRVSLGFRVGLDNNGKVHRSKNLGEWSNTIGCEMGSSQVRGLHYGQEFASGELPVENFKHE